MKELIAGKRVAVVGNAPEILDMDYGRVIDGHDLVLRMNRGIPSTEEQYMAIGQRTDILTGGVIAPLPELLAIPRAIFWFKHTALGAQHLHDILIYKPLHKTLVWHVPEAVFAGAARQVGKGVSSAIASIETLRSLDAGSVSVLGVSCCGQLEPGSERHWWTHADRYKQLEQVRWHNSADEARWMRNNCEQVGRLWWEVA